LAVGGLSPATSCDQLVYTECETGCSKVQGRRPCLEHRQLLQRKVELDGNDQ